MTKNNQKYTNVIIHKLPTKKNIVYTRTDFRKLENAVEIERSQNNAICNVKVIDRYVFNTDEPMYFSLYFGERRGTRARKLYEAGYYKSEE